MPLAIDLQNLQAQVALEPCCTLDSVSVLQSKEGYLVSCFMLKLDCCSSKTSTLDTASSISGTVTL